MPVTIFLSAVSDEFRVYRDQLRTDLTRHNVEVKVQEDFKDLGGDTLDKLDVYIDHCDAVVQLVGDMTGVYPGERELHALLSKYPDLTDKLPPPGKAPNKGAGVSYTQWEAWLALYHGKLLLIAKAAEAAERGPKYMPTEDSRAAQAQHLARLKAGKRFPGCTFNSPDNLAKCILGGAILDLLVKASNEPFIELLRERADTITSGFDQVIVILDKSSGIEPTEANTAREHLRSLRSEFLTLQKKHVDAVTAGNPILAHEIVGKIHTLQEEAVAVISSRIGTIGNRWYNNLGHKYWVAPTPEEDPEYHEIGRDLADLRAAAEARVKFLRYPGDAPPSTPANISNLIFCNDFPSRIHKD